MPPPGVYDGLANELESKGVGHQGRRRNRRVRGRRSCCPWAPIVLMIGLLDLHHAADAERREQGPVVRQEPREALVEHAEEGDVQGRRRRGRGQGRAAGNHRVPARAAEVPEARRPHPEGRAAHGLARHGQDAARARGRRRSQRAVLLDQRLGLRRDVRRRRRVARPRPVRAGQEERARASSSSTRSTPSAAIAAPASAAGTTSASRR